MTHRIRILPFLVAAMFPVAAPAALVCVNPGGTAGCLASITAAVAVANAGDTVSVAAGTYNESGIVVSKSINITGAGVDVTVVDGSTGGVNSPSAIIQYQANLSTTSTISQMTIRGGMRGLDLTGGNIVTVDHARVTANGPGTGAGIFNGSSQLTVSSSLIDGNSATDNSSIAGCDWGGGSGGGIASLCGGGSNHIVDTTITGNVAGRWGGGLIINDGTTLIENSTITGNSANFPDPTIAGGAIFMGGAFPDILVRFTTISNNSAVGSGGIWAGPQLKLYADLLQGNAGSACTGSPLTSLGYNVVSDASCGFAQPGDLASTNAMLQPLAMNGGATPTQAISAVSPAVDIVPTDNCTVFTDQRGTSRPQHLGCDAGAYEHVFTENDLVALLLSELTGANAGSAQVSQVTSILVAISNRRPQLACLALGLLKADVNGLAARNKIPSDKAAAIVETIGEIKTKVGCSG